MNDSAIKNINVSYDKDDGLFYIILAYHAGFRKTVAVTEEFFDDIGYIDAGERLKYQLPELTDQQIEKMLKEVFAYKVDN
jgi:hypothetical protein